MCVLDYGICSHCLHGFPVWRNGCAVFQSDTGSCPRFCSLNTRFVQSGYCPLVGLHAPVQTNVYGQPLMKDDMLLSGWQDSRAPPVGGFYPPAQPGLFKTFESRPDTSSRGKTLVIDQKTISFYAESEASDDASRESSSETDAWGNQNGSMLASDNSNNVLSQEGINEAQSVDDDSDVEMADVLDCAYEYEKSTNEFDLDESRDVAGIDGSKGSSQSAESYYEPEDSAITPQDSERLWIMNQLEELNAFYDLEDAEEVDAVAEEEDCHRRTYYSWVIPNLPTIKEEEEGEPNLESNAAGKDPHNTASESPESPRSTASWSDDGVEGDAGTANTSPNISAVLDMDLGREQTYTKTPTLSSAEMIQDSRKNIFARSPFDWSDDTENNSGFDLNDSRSHVFPRAVLPPAPPPPVSSSTGTKTETQTKPTITQKTGRDGPPVAVPLAPLPPISSSSSTKAKNDSTKKRLRETPKPTNADSRVAVPIVPLPHISSSSSSAKAKNKVRKGLKQKRTVTFRQPLETILNPPGAPAPSKPWERSGNWQVNENKRDADGKHDNKKSSSPGVEKGGKSEWKVVEHKKRNKKKGAKKNGSKKQQRKRAAKSILRGAEPDSHVSGALLLGVI